MIQNKYQIIKKIGQGQFGQIYQGLSRKKEDVAIKMEKKDSPISLLKQETTILRYLYEKSCNCIPTIYWFGPYENNLTLIMPFYECNLEQYNRSTILDRTKINKLTVQMIHILIQIHKHGVIHRDIKPQNFMMKKGELYLIDFGLATIYINEDKQPIIPKEKGEFIMGTPKFISLYIHYGIDPCRRDDLISVLYIYLYFYFEKLPWENVMCEENEYYSPYHVLHPKNQKRKSLKEDFHNTNTWKKALFDYIYQIQYDEVPHYHKIIAMIEEDI
jgi:serine/threonine protein kinase